MIISRPPQQIGVIGLTALLRLCGFHFLCESGFGRGIDEDNNNNNGSNVTFIIIIIIASFR